MAEGAPGQRRLPFVFQTSGGIGRLVLEDLPVSPVVVDRLELDVAELGTDPGVTTPERFQRRRTRLRSLVVKITASSIEERVSQVRRQLAALGVTQLSARLNDGFVSVRARAADGLAAADLSFRIQLVHAGTSLRALASQIRVHGHLPSPGPVIADRILAALLGATDTPGVVERPRVRGLCDAEIDLISGLLWHLMPPAGWRLPAVSNIELVAIKIGRSAIEIAYGPPGTRGGELGVRPQAHQLAAAHDLMHSVDAQLRDGHLEDAMRGYRALLAAGGPDQPLLLERILALAAARPAWFFDGLELARQALGRWPTFAPALAALASITLAQGDAREAAGHLTQLAQLASADGDDDQAALASLAGARLLRVLEPKSATQLYQLALEHDPGSAEAADSLADRLADEQRWAELVRLVRARAVSTADPQRAVALRLRLADVFVHQLGDPGSAQQELAAARLLAPEDPAVHEMTATILATIDPPRAIDAWREVARLAEARNDHRTCARAWAILGDLTGVGEEAEAAWRRAIELDPLQAEALGGLARAAAAKQEHHVAADLLERMRGIGLPQQLAARYELMLARAYLALDRVDDARGSLRRATIAGGETSAEAHAVLAEIAEANFDREHAAAELDTAIASLIDLAEVDRGGESDRLYKRAAQLAVNRAGLFDRSGQYALASEDYERAHSLAQEHAPELARDAAKTMLSRSGTDAGTERRWIDAVLATRPPAEERAALLVRRADVRRKERSPDLAAAIADLHEALQLIEDSQEPDAGETRKHAYQLEAELLAQSGDARARAQALTALAKLAERAQDRIEKETAAAAAWLAADEPAAALPHGARALASMTPDDDAPDVPAALRREVLVTLGEAAWRQRAWPDVIRAYRGLVDDPGAEIERIGAFRYRLAVAADRTGNAQLALETLAPLVTERPSEPDLVTTDTVRATTPEMRGQALRLFADLAERSGDLGGAASALEGFAALAVDSSPTSRADAVYRAGELFRRAGRDDDAIRCLEAALRISDTHLPALDALEAAWRERGDLERVSVILGRKVAATARHPARQKPLLSRLGDLQDSLGRPDVALATHQRALEIDPAWRPSLRYVTVRLRDAGQVVAAAGGLAQLAGELPNDTGVDLAIVARERQIAAIALAELVTAVDDSQLEAVREVAKPALERLQLDTPRTRDADQSSLTMTATAIESLQRALARLRGEAMPATEETREENTHSGKKAGMTGSALSLRDAAARARAAGKLDEALATLETANHVSPGDPNLVRELVELAQQVGDHDAAARHLVAFSTMVTGARRGDALLELADMFYDQLDDPQRGRAAMRDAATAFGAGKRHDTTLRMLATEAGTNLAWDVAIEALEAIKVEKRTPADIRSLALAYARAGHDAEAIAVLEDPVMAARFADGGELLAHLKSEVSRKAELDREIDPKELKVDELRTTRPGIMPPAEAEPVAVDLRTTRPGIMPPAVESAAEDVKTDPRTRTLTGLGQPAEREPAAPDPDDDLAIRVEDSRPPSEPRPIDDERAPTRPRPAEAIDIVTPRTASQAIARIKRPSSVPPVSKRAPTAPIEVIPPVTKRTPTSPPPSELIPPAPRRTTQPILAVDPVDTHVAEIPPEGPSVIITGTPGEQALAVALAAQFADRDTLLAARKRNPDDAAVLLALLAHLGDREPGLRHDVLDQASRDAKGRALAIARHELALLARETKATTRAAALWLKAYEADPTYAPVWIYLAEIQVAEDEIEDARELYEKVATSDEYDPARRAFAAERAEALGRDPSRVSGEITPPAQLALARAIRLADSEDWQGAIAEAESAAELDPTGSAALLLLERLYLEVGDITAASESIGRQLVAVEDPSKRAILWRRRARLYRDTLGRDAEAYRCLKEAHACAPADPEIAYQLRTAAMVRGEWALAASLLYREIAAAANPRDRGALHLELALIYDERLDDQAQAQVNYEQALAFDPTIPAAKLPLARRYEDLGRFTEAAKLYEAAASNARAGDRSALLEAAERARTTPPPPSLDLASQLEGAIGANDSEAALEIAHQLWRTDPGNATAFRILADAHRTSGDLAALTELTSVRASQTDAGEDRAAAWLEVARLAEQLDALDQAARAYDLALIDDPGNVPALDARGALAFRLGDWNSADLIYRDLGEGESILGDDELALRRSIIAERLGRDTESLAHAKAAAAIAPARRDIVMRVQDLATRTHDLDTALAAARSVLDLIPLEDDDAQLSTHFALVDLQRQAGNLDAAISQLERVLRDHPHHAPALEALVELQVARADWSAAARYLYQLVPLAPSPTARAERLFRLGETILLHLGDVDRADDAFLRASDLDPAHIPTLRRLLDVYWRADDPAALVEVASELAEKDALVGRGGNNGSSLAHAMIAAALVGETQLAKQIGTALGDDGPRRIAEALAELAGRDGRLQLQTASTAITELGRRGLVDLTKLRAAAQGTPVATVLAGQ